MTHQPLWAEVDLAALEANYRTIGRLIGPDIKVIVSIKADAYGHGAAAMSRAFQDFGADALATGTVDEALAVRAAGVTLPILLFATYLPEDIPALLEYDFIPTVHDLATAEAVSRAAARPRPVYVKVDAGFGRLGVPIADALAVVERMAALPNVVVEGVYTHVPFGRKRGRDWAAASLQDFDRLIADLAGRGLEVPVTQARASCCLLAGLEDACNAVCVGHAYYGLSPFAEDGVGDTSQLRPAFRALRTRLIHVAHHGQGSNMAIAGRYGLERGRTAGVVPLGLTNGFPRPAQGQTAQVLIGGRRVPVIAVSLEHMTLDLDGLDDARPGDPVTVIGADGGDEITLDEVARWQQRTPSEVLQMLAGRMERRSSRL
jgi:alanine racemase